MLILRHLQLVFHVEHAALYSISGRAERNGGTANHGTEGGADAERRAGTAREGAEGGRATAGRGGARGGGGWSMRRQRPPSPCPPQRAKCAVPARSGASAPPIVKWFAVP